MTAVRTRMAPDRSKRASREAVAQLRIDRRPSLAHPASWALGVLIVLFAVEFLLEPGWRWKIVGRYLFDEVVTAAVGRTILLTVLSLVLGMLLGLLVCAARLSRHRSLRMMALAYIWIIRALPIMVVLLFLFFLGALVPSISIGIPGAEPWVTIQTSDVVTRFGAALTGLSLYFGAKSAEIFRAGYMAVPAGQREAVSALGLSRWHTFTRVLGPQAFRILLPPLSNEVGTQFKNTAVVTVIGYGELLTTVQLLYSQNGYTVPMLTVAWIWYLALTSLLMVAQSALERRFGRGFDRRDRTRTKARTPAS